MAVAPMFFTYRCLMIYLYLFNGSWAIQLIRIVVIPVIGSSDRSILCSSQLSALRVNIKLSE